MSLLTGFNVSPAEVTLLGAASNAAFSGRAVPSGWTVATTQQLGLAARFSDGSYFTNDGASAIVLRSGYAWIVSFRGTDGLNDVGRYPELLLHSYIDHFQPLLAAVAAQASVTATIYFTGASLGGAAVNELADYATSQYGGRFATAKFVAFASPEITNAAGVVNVGFENDPVFKVLNAYRDAPSSLDNIVLATANYQSGNYDGQHPFDGYAHDTTSGFDALARVTKSSFLDLMTPDSLIIVDAYQGLVTDITPGRETFGAFYIGQEVSDRISGRAGDDHIEGFGGDDFLIGGAGNDTISGGNGRDTAVFSVTRVQAQITGGVSDHVVVTVTEGIDTLKSVEVLQFSDGRLVYDVTDPAAATLRLYDTAFDRAPDPSGLHYWTLALQTQGEIAIAANFLNSAEFQTKYGTLSDTQFVQALYVNALNRTSDTGGQAFWTQALSGGAVSRTTLLASFSESGEHVEITRSAVEIGLWDPGTPLIA